MGKTIQAGDNLYKLGHWLIRDPNKAKATMPNIVDDKLSALIEATKLETHYQLTMKQLTDFDGPIPDPVPVPPSQHIGVYAHGVYIAIHPNIISYLAVTLANASIGSSILLGIRPVSQAGYNVPDGYGKMVIEVYPVQGWSGEAIN